MLMNPKPLSYEDAGVSIDRGNRAVERIRSIADATRRPEVVAGVGGFAGAFRWDEPGLLVAGADGVGSKVLIAQLLDRHRTIGIDLVAMNVNDVLAAGAEPLFFLDYIAIGRVDPELVADLVTGIGEGCRQAGCALLGGETAEMPGLYASRAYDLAGFAVGRKVWTGGTPEPGDRVIGVASSGFHSNGFSLVRAVVDQAKLDWDAVYPATEGRSLGEALLAPTVIYVAAVRSLWDKVTVKAMAHITGGGLVENLPRTLPAKMGAAIMRERWQTPPIFGWLQALGQIPEAEMWRTFNMGIGFTLVVSPDHAEAAVAHMREAGLSAWDIGAVEESPGVRIV